MEKSRVVPACRAARAWWAQVLRESGDEPRLPWHRVTGAGGRIAFPAGSANARKQLARLAREGIPAAWQPGSLKRKAARSLDALLWKQ